MHRGMVGLVSRHRVRFASAVVVAAAAASLVAYAVSATGYTVQHASLNDGGVWVTNGSTGQFGRLNKPISQLDGAVFTPTPQTSYNIDVLQDGAAVVGVDRGRGELYPLDVSLLTTSKDGVALPGNPAVGIGGGVLALLDRAKGTVRAVTFDPEQPLGSIAGLGAGKPLASVGANAALAVGWDGTIYAASASRGLTTIRRSGAGFGTAQVQALDVPGASLSVSAVGDAPVVLATQPSSSTATAILPDGATVQLPNAAGAVLQQPGPATTSALVATPHELLSVPLSAGQPRSLFQGGKGTTPAAPVYLGGCAFAAWPAPIGVFASSCGGGPTKSAPIPQPSTVLTFRVNRQELLLNDSPSGNTWNVDARTTLRQVANWATVKRPTVRPNKKTKNNRQNTNQNRPLPPKAVDDELGARPGRTTSLYVLDNDSDPDGEILSVDSVSASSRVKNWLSIAPDGQTVSIALPPGTTGDTTFKYVVRAAKGGTASATVTVHARTPSQFTNPVLRNGAKPRTWTVPESGTVTIPALSDWRDYVDGDPVVLTGAHPSAGQVATTPDGALIYTAPAQPGPQTISYTVGTGMGGKNHGRIAIQVEGVDGRPVPAQAEPDYARGQVGKPIVVEPLANDLPGCDPLNPTATMTLAGLVASPVGATVRTDTTSGTVTVTASKPGSYLLDYQVAYGAAPLANGLIRVDVDPAAADKPPVVAPISAVLHGQKPVTVDVLASAADPAGNLLVVQHAAASDPSQLNVAIVDGQFVRMQAATATLTPATQIVQFTVTDGVTGAVSGEITVTQLPAVQNDTPITITDYARVRSGASVAIPVLDNDSTPNGDPVSLVPDVPNGLAPGRYSVTPALGAAYVSGRLVRYVAPPARSVTKTTTVTIDYYAQDQAGDRQQVGHAQVTITPPVSKTNPDQPPAPQEVDARAVAGDTVSIKIPTDGMDPDGDPVVLTGIGSAPQLGRVLGFTATSISYQAYPQTGNGGTDTFSYVVSDPYGMTAEGTVRVAVVPPGDPQPPVAVDDTVTVAPGADVRVDVLANDIVAPDDHVTIGNLAKLNPQLPKGVRLLSPTGPIEVPANSDVKQPVVFRYQISDGLAFSRATVTVHSQKGVDLPPVAFDQYAQAKSGAAAVVVDLLHGDYDPDSTAPLTVVGPAGAVGGRLTVRLTGEPRVIPYVIQDAGGAQASAVVYVPGTGAGAPYAKPGAQIAVPYNGSATIAVGDYVIDPAHEPLRTTTSDTISASPAGGLTATAGADATHLVLRAGKNYDGPAAVTFQVTDGATLTTKGAAEAYVTVPVQVGASTPQLRCPSTPITVMEGGPAVALPIAALCHVWTPNPADSARLRFTGRWTRQPAGVSLSGSGTAELSLRASGSATASDGTLLVSVAGARAVPQPLTVQVIKAPKLTVAPIALTGIQAGHSATVDIAAYVTSPLADARISVVPGTPRWIAGMPASISANGARVTIAPGADSHGTITFALVVTDVADQSRTDRQVPAQITLQVLGHPGAPTGLAASRTVKSHEVDLTWVAPADNGAPIVRYIGTYNGGNRFSCGAAPACAVTGLQNGVTYTFTVTAYNAVGPGPSSAPTSATPDSVPGPVTGFVGSNPQDGALTLTWTADVNPGGWSPVTSYVVAWQGGRQTVPGSQTTMTATGLKNGKAYDFTIIAINKQGPSTPSHASGILQSAGKPATPAAPTVTVADDTATNSRVANLSWSAVDPQGPTPVYYTVIRTGGGATTNPCVNTTQTTCTDPGIKLDGTVYTYAVQAHNAAGSDPAHTSAVGPSTTMEAAATPDGISNIQTHVVSATPDGQAPVTFQLGASHGKTSMVTCSYSGGTCASPATYSVEAQAASETLAFSAGYSGSFTLTQCNGSSGTGYAGQTCVTSAAVSVNVNAPPSQPGGGSCGLSGNIVIFNWGASRSYGARTLDHYAMSNAINGNTTATSASVNEPADGGTSTLTVVAVDSNGEQSSSNSYTCPHAAPPPPPPTVTVTKGTACNGSTCSKKSPGACTSSSCAFIHVQTSNFPGSVTCSFNSQTGNGGFVNETYGANDSKDSWDFYGQPRDWVSVTCNGVTDQMTWY